MTKTYDLEPLDPEHRLSYHLQPSASPCEVIRISIERAVDKLWIDHGLNETLGTENIDVDTLMAIYKCDTCQIDLVNDVD